MSFAPAASDLQIGKALGQLQLQMGTTRPQPPTLDNSPADTNGAANPCLNLLPGHPGPDPGSNPFQSLCPSWSKRCVRSSETTKANQRGAAIGSRLEAGMTGSWLLWGGSNRPLSTRTCRQSLLKPLRPTLNLILRRTGRAVSKDRRLAPNLLPILRNSAHALPQVEIGLGRGFRVSAGSSTK